MSRFLVVAAVPMLASMPLSAARAKEAPPAMKRFNVECPAPRECTQLERERRACESGKSCDGFLAAMKRLLPEYDCQRPFDRKYIVPAIWLCLEVKDHELVHDGFGDALSTLSKLNTSPALTLFASSALRNTLTGEYAGTYRELSDKAERRLVVGDGDPGGPGPYIEGGNFPDMMARASSTSPAAGGESFDASMAVDGKAFTAWCAGAEKGTGEWLEVSLRPPPWHEGKPFCVFSVIPGYARTQMTYLAHKRPTRVKIASCARPENSFEAELKTSVPEDFNRALVSVDVPAGTLGGEGGCVRVTLLGVSQGGAEPPCISEVAPEYDCGNAAGRQQQSPR